MSFRNSIKIFRRNLKHILFPKSRKTKILTTNGTHLTEKENLQKNTQEEWNLKTLITKSLQKKSITWSPASIENGSFCDWASQTNVLPYHPKSLSIKAGLKHFKMARNEFLRLTWTSPMVVSRRNFHSLLLPKSIHTSSASDAFIKDGLTEAKMINPIIEEECYLEKCRKLDEELDVGTEECPKTPICDTPENRKKYCKPVRHHTWGCEIPPPNDDPGCREPLACFDPKKVPKDSDCKPKNACCIQNNNQPTICNKCIRRMLSTSAFLKPRLSTFTQVSHYCSQYSNEPSQCFKSSTCYQPEKPAQEPCPKFVGSLCRAGGSVKRECPKICLAGCKPPADRDYCPDQEMEVTCVTQPAPYLSFSEANLFQFRRPRINECTLQEMRIFNDQVKSANFKDMTHRGSGPAPKKPADCNNGQKRTYCTMARPLLGNNSSLLTRGFHTSSLRLDECKAEVVVKPPCDYKPVEKKIDPCKKDPCVTGRCLERPHELCGHCIPLEFTAPCYEMQPGVKPDCKRMELPPCKPKVPIRPCPPPRPPMSKPKRCGLPHGPAECLIDKCKRFRECCRDYPPPVKMFPCPQECEE